MIYTNYDGYIQSFIEITPPVQKIFKGFTIYGHGGHLGPVTCTIYTNFDSPFIRMLHMKFEFEWPSCFREDVQCSRTLWVTTMTRDARASYPISSPVSPIFKGELTLVKIHTVSHFMSQLSLWHLGYHKFIDMGLQKLRSKLAVIGTHSRYIAKN